MPTGEPRLQVTPVWLVPETAAENACDCPALSETAAGLTVTVMVTGISPMNTDAAWLGSATLVAVAVTVWGTVIKEGAL